MEHDPRYAQWSAVLTGLGLGSLTIGAIGFPTDRPQLEHALMTSWPKWTSHGSYPMVLPKDFSIYAMRSTLMDRLGYISWEWRRGIQPLLTVETARPSDALAQFAQEQPVAPDGWEELARLVSAELLPPR